jgi:hypothetical protein
MCRPGVAKEFLSRANTIKSGAARTSLLIHNRFAVGAKTKFAYVSIRMGNDRVRCQEVES